MHVFTAEEVANINDYQKSSLFHPLTWGETDDDSGSGHDKDGKENRLVATEAGLVNPKTGNVVQTDAADFIKDGSWRM